jgi:hypothetical protein
MLTVVAVTQSLRFGIRRPILPHFGYLPWTPKGKSDSFFFSFLPKPLLVGFGHLGFVVDKNLARKR